MRLPNTREISDEQVAVYLDAPFEGFILVTGPPGTGKTVIAFLRARALAKEHRDVTVLMYNKVLSRYTLNAGVDGVKSSTLASWTWKWWMSIRGPRSRPPMGEPVEGSNWRSVDWDSVARDLIPVASEGGRAATRMHWGHLVIDEAQDFPPAMFRAFRMLEAVLSCTHDGDGPALTILADENQRLNPQENSTIKDIQKGLGLGSERQFTLTTNFRNALPIAELARHFYCGLRTGQPDLPARDGDVPEMLRCSSLNTAVDRIVRYARSHENEEIGVILGADRLRKKFFNKLKNRLGDGGRIRVQTYTSKRDDVWNDPERLRFDDPGTVTVINKQSAKGLEFDAVFLPELQDYRVTPTEVDQFRMDMYVLISRARSRLFVLYSQPDGDPEPAVLKYFRNLPGLRWMHDE